MNAIKAKRTSATGAWLRWSRRAVPLGAAAVAVALLAGCGGGGSSGGTAQAGSTSSKQSGGVRYAQCMRAHGVTNFPDPTANGGIDLSKSTVDSPQFQTASQACRSLAPGGVQSGGTVSAQDQAQALSFARCMRSHGVPAFPDPSFAGGVVGFGISHAMRNSPGYSTAGQACRSLTAGGRGSITPIGGSGS